MVDEKKVENWLRNYALGTAVERALIGGPLYTSKDVWGKEVRFNKHIKGEEWEVISHKLRNYYASLEFTERELIEDEILYLTGKELVNSFVDITADKIKEQNIEMFGGESFLNLPLTEKNKYTCHQLCDWTWLEYDDGKILRATKNEEGENVYKATLVKYAIVLDENGEPV